MKETMGNAAPYLGPEFDEYCISEGKYLPATRDRTPCTTCPLGNLCQVGFEEQIRRIAAGKNPSLTDGCAFPDKTLTPRSLLNGLTSEQQSFLRSKIPSLSESQGDHVDE
jgi:hypothetical protein